MKGMLLDTICDSNDNNETLRPAIHAQTAIIACDTPLPEACVANWNTIDRDSEIFKCPQSFWYF